MTLEEKIEILEDSRLPVAGVIGEVLLEQGILHELIEYFDAMDIGGAVLDKYLDIKAENRDHADFFRLNPSSIVLVSQIRTSYIDDIFYRDSIRDDNDKQIGIRWYSTEALENVIDEAVSRLKEIDRKMPDIYILHIVREKIYVVHDDVAYSYEFEHNRKGNFVGTKEMCLKYIDSMKVTGITDVTWM